ncbi:hypothetical protein ACFO5Q_09595 [Kordiimonas lipolytica]|uniref:Transcriptional regulator n=1 Tax=Kordiimonas lipolytica TaxID=1662421 RepID=A0ABV8UA73_9PROT|nr:MarR family winged helix-turn-helix transcriptional regulator [Kordiimonas lipolytica]
MGNKEILHELTNVFKRSYPGLTAEAIICFMVAANEKDPTVGDVARVVGMTEPMVYQHLSTLTSAGAGLIGLVNTGDGRNLVQLTPEGQELASSLNQSVS